MARARCPGVEYISGSKRVSTSGARMAIGSHTTAPDAARPAVRARFRENAGRVPWWGLRKVGVPTTFDLVKFESLGRAVLPGRWIAGVPRRD